MKIVLGTDGSDHSLLAETLLCSLRCLAGSEVFVCSVFHRPAVMGALFEPIGEGAYLQECADLWEGLKTHADVTVSQTIGRLAQKGIKANGAVLEGDPADQLIKAVKDNSADLAVIGSRGENALEGFLLGSIARKMATYCPSSVLLARHYEHRNATESMAELNGKPGLKALVAVDDSPGAQAAVDFVVKMGKGCFSEIETVCAAPLMILPPGFEPQVAIEELQCDQTEAQPLADKAAQQLAGLSETINTHCQVGRPAAVIMERAREIGADMIILGATRHARLERFLLGSVSYEVATGAPCSVLIVRTSTIG